ncbi:MAG: PilZ domain-containing protein [Thermodesulfovibrionales bacterium]
MSKREAKRYVRRLEAEFEGGGLSGRGLTSDISRKGVFIRTQKALAPGTPVIVKLHLADGRISIIKGIVKRAIKVPIYASEIKNGMGIEIKEVV